jgi:two-component system response regulator FlrC
MEQAAPVVLLVEDNPAVRQRMVNMLVERGLPVRDFDSGAALLAYAAESTEAVGLLVTDVEMPGMDGFEVASSARRRWPSLPVLVMSAAHRLSRDAIAEVGPTLLMDKPLDYADLVCHVDVLLSNKTRH